MAKRVLVTGSSGYLGTALTKRLERGHKEGEVEKVVGIDIREPRYKPQDGFFRFFNFDVRNALFGILEDEKIDTVVHLAWIVGPTRKSEKKWEYDVDVFGSLNVLDCCAGSGVENIVVASTSKHYSNDKRPPWKETDSLNHNIPKNGFSYGRNKVIMEEDCQKHREETGARVVVFRPTHLWGAEVNNHLSKRFTDDPFITVIKGKDSQRGFIHVDDAADYFYRASVDENLDGIYNISGGSILHSEAARMAGDGFKKPVVHLPECLTKGIVRIGHTLHILPYSVPYMYTVIRDIILDTEKVEKEIGKPKYTAREAFEEFVEAHRNER